MSGADVCEVPPSGSHAGSDSFTVDHRALLELLLLLLLHVETLLLLQLFFEAAFVDVGSASCVGKQAAPS